MMAFLATGLTVGVARAAPDGAELFIQSLANRAIDVLQAPDATLEQRETRFRDLLKSRFAMMTIGKFVLGPYWRKANEAQREEYMDLFAEWIVKTYAVRFGGYTDERFTIIGSRINDADKDVFVHSRIDKPNSDFAFDADWRVRQMNGEYKIIDVMVAGISMAVTQRSEFNNVARKRGIDGLLQILRENIKRLEQRAN